MSDKGLGEDLIAQRYKFLFPRARGGFSDVIIAWDTRLTRRVAIKKIIKAGGNLSVASLEEARTAALLSSPNIVNIYDFEGGVNETLIIMENVDGPSLAELMKDSTELLSLDVVTTILEGIVSALEYAHENQVLHLDIKPANVLIDQSGHIKVSDFGLAELAGISGFGEVQGGTIGYMPPEQLTGELVDVRTDLWGFASLCYQLLTGINPFFALSIRESLSTTTLQNYALPSELRPTLVGAIDEALIKALSPMMEQRQASVAELWLELRPHLGKIGAGRRSLKALVRGWVGKEAALLEDSSGSTREESDRELDESQSSLFELDLNQDYVPATQEFAIWDSGLRDSGDYQDSDRSKKDTKKEERRDQRRSDKEEKRTKANQRQKKKREPGPPLWQRLNPKSQSFFSRCVCALGVAGMVWLAMSALPYLGDPLAQAATAAAANTGSPAPALLDAAFVVRLALVLVALIATLLVPRIGVAIAVVCLGIGLFFTGNWFIGILVLAGCVAWWVCIGRRSLADSIVVPLAPVLAMLSLPMLVPLLAGYIQNWRRALGTAALGCFLCSLLSLVSHGFITTLFGPAVGIGTAPAYGQLSEPALQSFLNVSPALMQMPHSNLLFVPLAHLFTAPEFWFILVSWLCASVVMSLLCKGKSRVKYTLATFLSTSIVAAGYLIPLSLFVGAHSATLLTALIVRLVIALAFCLLLILVGVQPQHCDKESKGRTR
ncbi:MAG: serine/threonine protein kinase [Coriobacteriia bacterium]|nr:serine/threonine protein kinase [Coriobacteriia bacterium]